MRISDWSSDVCSSDLEGGENGAVLAAQVAQFLVVIALVFLDLAFARGDCRLDPRQLGGFFLGRLALASGFKMTAHPIGIRPGNLRLGISPAILAGGFGDGIEPILHKVHDKADRKSTRLNSSH